MRDDASDSPTEIDVSQADTAAALHDLLADRLGFPSYYGRNWDAFDDCICDPDQSDMPAVLRIHGWESLRARLPREAQLLRQCLDDLRSERDDVRVEWAS